VVPASVASSVAATPEKPGDIVMRFAGNKAVAVDDKTPEAKSTKKAGKKSPEVSRASPRTVSSSAPSLLRECKYVKLPCGCS